MPIDIQTLLAPISEPFPCGDDLQFSNEFDEIGRARRFDDPSLDQGEWVTPLKEADWKFVIERCTMLLQTRTKDLRLAAWLAEALAVEEGIAGLEQGYVLLAGLSERFWEHLHPQPEDGDDAEFRLGNVTWLINRSAGLLRAMALTSGAQGAFSSLDWEAAVQAAQAVKRDPDRAAEVTRGKPSVEQIEVSKRASSTVFYQQLLAGLDAFDAAMRALEAELNRRAADAAPGLHSVRAAYDDVRRLAERFARERGVAQALAVSAGSTVKSTTAERREPTLGAPGWTLIPEGVAMPETSNFAGGEIRDRVQAIAQLHAVARFFRRTEPHSPVAYLAEKAAQWANMPLEQWLSSVVKDGNSLAHIRELLGLDPDASPQDGGG